MNSQEYRNLSEAYLDIYQELDERKYDPDEKLPSGRTPNQKMSRAQDNHGARYITEPSPSRFADRRLDTTKSSSLDRGRKVKDIQDVIKSGQDPRDATIKSNLDGKERQTDLRKWGRPGVTPEDRASRTVRDPEGSAHTQGGLRAHKTRAGGYRTVIRKEDFDTIKEYLIDEGYADTNESALVIMANMSEDWKCNILEKFSMAADPSKPQSPKRTKLPRSREEKIGPHNDWKDKPTEWGELPPAAKKLRSRAITVTGTQRRQDIETGVR